MKAKRLVELAAASVTVAAAVASATLVIVLVTSMTNDEASIMWSFDDVRIAVDMGGANAVAEPARAARRTAVRNISSLFSCQLDWSFSLF